MLSLQVVAWLGCVSLFISLQFSCLCPCLICALRCRTHSMFSWTLTLSRDSGDGVHVGHRRRSCRCAVAFFGGCVKGLSIDNFELTEFWCKWKIIVPRRNSFASTSDTLKRGIYGLIWVCTSLSSWDSSVSRCLRSHYSIQLIRLSVSRSVCCLDIGRADLRFDEIHLVSVTWSGVCLLAAETRYWLVYCPP